jgi:hypothetical protein
MSEQSAGVKAFEDKVSAQLHEAKSQIAEIESRAKGQMAQAETDTINGFKAKSQEIDKKRQDLKASSGEKAAQIKAEIEAGAAKLKASVEQFGAKLKSHAAAK